MTLASLFYNPIQLPSDSLLVWLVLPLCVAVAVVYKTLRTRSLRRLPLEIGLLMLYMVLGLAALGAGLWLIQEYWV